MLLSGSNDITRVAFMAIIEHAVKEVCTPMMVKKAFSATGIIPFNPNKIDLDAFPTSSEKENPESSPLKATCSNCRMQNVSLHPLVRQGLVPKKLADVFVYSPPPETKKSMSKAVKHARIVTSEEVKQEIVEKELKKKKILKNSKNTSKSKRAFRDMVKVASEESDEIIDFELEGH